MRALHALIRFYISIEDGECVVERDLGELSAFNDAHQHVDSALADDLMLVKSDPIEFKDVCGDEATSGSTTTEVTSGSTATQVAVGSCAAPQLAVGSGAAPQLAVGSARSSRATCCTHSNS